MNRMRYKRKRDRELVDVGAGIGWERLCVGLAVLVR